MLHVFEPSIARTTNCERKAPVSHAIRSTRQQRKRQQHSGPFRNISNNILTRRDVGAKGAKGTKLDTSPPSATSGIAVNRLSANEARARGQSFAKYYKQLKASRMDRAPHPPAPAPARAKDPHTALNKGIASSIRLRRRPRSAPRSRHSLSTARSGQTSKLSTQNGNIVEVGGASVKMVSRSTEINATGSHYREVSAKGSRFLRSHKVQSANEAKPSNSGERSLRSDIPLKKSKNQALVSPPDSDETSTSIIIVSNKPGTITDVVADPSVPSASPRDARNHLTTEASSPRTSPTLPSKVCLSELVWEDEWALNSTTSASPASPAIGGWGRSQSHDPVFSQLYCNRPVRSPDVDDSHRVEITTKKDAARSHSQSQSLVHSEKSKNSVVRAFMSPNARLLSLVSQETPYRRMPKARFGVLDKQNSQNPKLHSVLVRAGKGKLSRRPTSAH